MLRKCIYGNNKSKIYTVVLGQYSEGLKGKLEGQEDWDTIQKDLVKVIKSIKAQMINE